MDKQEIRVMMKWLNVAIRPDDRIDSSEAIFAAIERLPAFSTARTVALYCALKDEPPTDAALVRWGQTKRLVVPRVEGDVMNFYDYRPSTMRTGAFGISEPDGMIPCMLEEIDFIVVPGVAFSHDGNRLGRGKGYYDKYMSQNGFRAFKVGVCYPHQIIGDIPYEAHDIVMDTVIKG